MHISQNRVFNTIRKKVRFKFNLIRFTAQARDARLCKWNVRERDSCLRAVLCYKDAIYNSKNLIYLIHCLRCNKQYIGETKRRLKDRFNEHRWPVDRPTPSSRHTAVSDHFLSDNHSPNDIELIPLELIHSSRDALRKAREAYLIERGQTLEPRGINKREEI